VTPSSRQRRAHLAVLLAAASLAAAADSSVPLPRLQLHAGEHAFTVEVARTPQQRARGLMGRTRLDDGAGMLFVFESAARHCFWMRDTPLPLSIAFVDTDGRIVSLADMQPHSETLHCPPADIRYALEVKQGEFHRRSIAAGTRVDGLPQ
jgi:uncharacterized membrane protein (UPF0127 family)